MQSPLLSHSFCQHQQPFLTYFRDSETGVRRLGFYPRWPQPSWVTLGKSWPLFAFIFLSDKQSVNKIYFLIWRGFFNINRNYIYMVLNFFYFITNTKSNVNTSPADRVYSAPLRTLSYLLIQEDANDSCWERAAMLEVAQKFPHASRSFQILLPLFTLSPHFIY